MQWVRAEMAPGTVARPKAAKLLRASSVASPEFCIPTSTETVRASRSRIPRVFESRYPSRNPRKCRITTAHRREAPLSRMASFLAARMKSTMNTIDSTARNGVYAAMRCTCYEKND